MGREIVLSRKSLLDWAEIFRRAQEVLPADHYKDITALRDASSAAVAHSAARVEELSSEGAVQLAQPNASLSSLFDYTKAFPQQALESEDSYDAPPSPPPTLPPPLHHIAAPASVVATTATATATADFISVPLSSVEKRKFGRCMVLQGLQMLRGTGFDESRIEQMRLLIHETDDCCS